MTKSTMLPPHVVSGHLQFAPDILQRLGEELIPNPEQGLIELVKNSYDADASRCCVHLHEVSEKGGKITIEDDGEGMSEQDLLHSFLLIGRSNKSAKKRTLRERRLTVGDKGLGRLAALRLGSRVRVRSRSRNQPGTEVTLEINWSQVDIAQTIESVDFPLISRSTTLSHGVTIEIDDLYKPLNSPDVGRLARELILLSDPFKDVEEDSIFEVELKSPEFEQWEERVQKSYFDAAKYVLEAHLDEQGRARVTLHDSEGHLVYQISNLSKGDDLYNAPPANFKLWVYLLGKGFSAKQVSLNEVKAWLRAVGGVHVYHRNLRVRPYGDAGSDWLDMNLARAKHPEVRPSTNTVIGRVTVEDANLALEQPTNRIGFIESEAFYELRRFAQDALEWMATERLKDAEERRQKERKVAPSESLRALSALREVIQNSVPEEFREELDASVLKFADVKEKEGLVLREDLQLYRTLATAGTTSAVFAHESANPITLIRQIAETIELRNPQQMEMFQADFFAPQVAQLKDASQSLEAYTQFPLHHLRREKRRSKDVNVHQVWESIAALFEPLLEKSKISISLDFPDEPIFVRGSVALVEAIATNLVTNSKYALTSPNGPLKDRRIAITGTVVASQFIVTHADNGPGIEGISLDEIWLPGKTTSPNGTGFGLTIVRDSVGDLKGEISAEQKGSLGGAEFKVTLPLVQE